MSHSFKFVALVAFIVTSCMPANDAEIIEATSTTEPMAQDTPVATSTAIPTATYAVKYPYMVETPFWESYQTSTAVPISEGSLKTTRIDYLEMSIEEGVGSGWWMLPFRVDFETAISQNLEWIQYPEQVALRISGYPNPDYPAPEEVKLYRVSATTIIAVITDRNRLDDSVSAHEYRIEMTFFDNYWQVEWLGLRWQCRRGHEEWGITPCA